MFCKNDVFKGFTKFIRKHLCWRLVLNKQRAGGLLKRYFSIDAFLWVFNTYWTPIYTYLLICFMKINNLPQKGNKRIGVIITQRGNNSWSICQLWCCKYLCLLKQIWFRSSLTFLRELYSPIKFEILCDQTINSSCV